MANGSSCSSSLISSSTLATEAAPDAASLSGSSWAAAASACTVLCTNTSAMVSRSPDLRALLTTPVASSEWPPSSKKSSSIRTPLTPSTSENTSTSRCSAGVLGSRVGVLVPKSGSGSALRSTFPLGVNGNAGSTTRAAGTMYSGSETPSERFTAAVSSSPEGTRT